MKEILTTDKWDKSDKDIYPMPANSFQAKTNTKRMPGGGGIVAREQKGTIPFLGESRKARFDFFDIVTHAPNAWAAFQGGR